MRLGGMVAGGSIRHLADGVTIRFDATDGKASIPVEFTGIVPDLFAEESGMVADGRMRADGVFVADRILAKHDERYMPPQMGRTEGHTYELPSLMRITYASLLLTKNTQRNE